MIINNNYFDTKQTKIVYILSKISNKTIKQIYPRRRKNTRNPYIIIDQILKNFAVAFENSETMQKKKFYQIYKRLKQRSK